MTDTNPKIENCPLSFECAAQWSDLAPTADQAVRHCAACKEDVHLCRTTDELSAAWKRGVCVAIDIPDYNSRLMVGKMPRITIPPASEIKKH